MYYIKSDAVTQRGVSVSQETGNAFASIIAAVHETLNSIEQISMVTTKQVEVAKKVEGINTSIAVITENTAANSQQVSAATEEQTATIDSLANAANKLEILGNSLNALVARFKLKA